MYDLSELEVKGKDMAIAVLIVVVFLVAVFLAGYCVGVERTEDLYNNGTGTGDAGKQLGEAVSHQQQITDGIKDAEHTSAGIAETSTAIAESAGHIEEGIGKAAGLIDSSQQILGRIRNRGQKGTPAN